MRGLPWKSLDHHLSKSMSSWAYLRRSDSYCIIEVVQSSSFPEQDELWPLLTVLRSESGDQPRRTYTTFHARNESAAKAYHGDTSYSPRLWVSPMLAFMPWPANIPVSPRNRRSRHYLQHVPAFGECVWQASPAINARSSSEYLSATR